MKRLLLLAGLAGAFCQPASAEFITDTPEGTLKSYIRSSDGYRGLMYFAMGLHDTGSKVDIVVDEDVVYMNCPMIKINSQGWLKGYIDNGEYVFNFPQEFYEEEGEIYSAYLLDYNGTAPDALPTRVEMNSYKRSKNQEYRFRIDGDRIVSATPGFQTIIGMMMPDEAGGMTWSGFGDCNYEMVPFPADVITTPPADLATESYAFIHDGIGSFVDMGVTSTGEVYMRGLSLNSQEGWVKGSLDGSQLTLPSGQCTGVLSELNTIPHYAIIYGFEGGKDNPSFLPSITFRHNETDGTYASTGNMLINRGFSPSYNPAEQGYIPRPRLTPQKREVLKPAHPDNVNYEAGVLTFDLTQLSTDGRLIDRDNLYYCVWIDDEIYTLYPDEYPYLNLDELTYIHTLFTEYFDILPDGKRHEMVIYPTNFKRIGVQALYMSEGKILERSVIAYAGEDPDASISDAGIAPVVSTEMTDLQGRRVANPGQGLYIMRQQRADGSFTTTKVIRR